jgi:hypothetical protein
MGVRAIFVNNLACPLRASTARPVTLTGYVNAQITIAESRRSILARFGELFQKAAVSHSFLNAGRSAHFKIVAVALICFAITLICLTVHSSINSHIASPSVIRAKTSIDVTAGDTNKMIR